MKPTVNLKDLGCQKQTTFIYENGSCKRRPIPRNTTDKVRDYSISIAFTADIIGKGILICLGIATALGMVRILF